MTVLRPHSDSWRSWIILAAGLALGFACARFSAPATRVQVHGRSLPPEPPASSSIPDSPPNFTVSSIPRLTPEAKKRVKERLQTPTPEYDGKKVRSGVNPFAPLPPRADRPPPAAGVPPVTPPPRQGPTKLTFWGVLRTGPGEPLRAIVDYDDAPRCWIGAVGEGVEGTGYRLIGLDPGGAFAEFERISGHPGHIRVEADEPR